MLYVCNMILSAIAAISTNNAIGHKNALPWHLPADMKYFMNTTRHHHVIMGRKTFESLGKPLKKRTNVVITRDTTYRAEGVEVVHSLHQAISIARQNGEMEAFIIGGAQIYSLSIPILNRLYLTEIETEVTEADAYFPVFNREEWQLISAEHHSPDEKNKFSYTFRVFERIQS